ncbi:MAG: biopolymer transporter ExbD [Bdellovibrionota bacterium]
MSFSKRKKKLPQNFKIQITSMVDMFVILLVFLIKSYSTSPVQIAPSADIRLPPSESTTNPVDVLKLMVSKSGVYVEGQKVIDLTEGQIDKKYVDGSDTNYIPELFKFLDAEAKKTQDIAKVNSTVTFEGKILVQADKDLAYEMLRKVMHTSAVAGYSDVKFAVISND